MVFFFFSKLFPPRPFREKQCFEIKTWYSIGLVRIFEKIIAKPMETQLLNIKHLFPIAFQMLFFENIKKPLEKQCF